MLVNTSVNFAASLSISLGMSLVVNPSFSFAAILGMSLGTSLASEASGDISSEDNSETSSEPRQSRKISLEGSLVVNRGEPMIE